MEAKQFIKENYTLTNGGEDYVYKHSGQLVGAEDIAEQYYKYKLESSTLQSEKAELVEVLHEFVEWANIQDGSPSQYLRDKAEQLLTKING